MTPSASPTRILYAESNTDGTVGGSHYCLLWLTESLDRSRFEPVVVFYQHHALVDRFKQARLDVRILERPTPIRFPVRLLQKGLNVFGWMKLVMDYRAFLNHERIGLLHLNNSVERHHDWMIAALLNGTPCITHERGINTHYSWASRTLAPRLKAVISMSRRIVELMTERGVPGGNIRVMYDGLDPTRLQVKRPAEEIRKQFQIEPDQPVVGIVGNIRRWKGQEIVVRAMSVVRKTHPRAVCLLVGDTAAVDKPYEEHVRRVIAELGVEANIRFTGYQSNVPDFHNAMDVAIHASVDPEPFGMVVLEAMARRKPIIGSREGGVPEMIVDGVTGYTFEPGNWEELGARLTELLSDPARARDMGERGYERLIQHFTLKQYVSDMESFYTELLAGGPGTPQPLAVATNR